MMLRRSALRAAAAALPRGHRLYVARLDWVFVSKESFQAVLTSLQSLRVGNAAHLPGSIRLEDMTPLPPRRKR